MTAQTKTLPALYIIAADMRRVCEAEPRAPHASAQRTAGPLTITLTRSGAVWAISLRCAGRALQPHTVDLWAAACGAPSLDWTRTERGRCWRAAWIERAEGGAA
jgi:hypothetical protein